MRCYRNCAAGARSRGHRDSRAGAANEGHRGARALLEVPGQPAPPQSERARVVDAARASDLLGAQEYAERDDLRSDSRPRGACGAHAALYDEQVVAEEVDNARDADRDQRQPHVAPRKEGRLQLGRQKRGDEADRANCGVAHGARQQRRRRRGHRRAAEERLHERHTRRCEDGRGHACAADGRRNQSVVQVSVARFLVSAGDRVGDQPGRDNREEREDVAARVAHGGRRAERG
mmetsp:Transcript_19614/g.35428  ORF Transcript_19614/g.35428 Transcript_19614/m.35428 type:complete len:233 (+) Transcript_19614:1101-1799(+)